MRPQGIVCCICGKEYLKASLPHHQKTCAALHHVATEICEKCDKLIVTSDKEAHLATRCLNSTNVTKNSGKGKKNAPTPLEQSPNIEIYAPVKEASPPQNKKTNKLNKKKNTPCQYTIGRPSIPNNFDRKLIHTNVTSPDNPLLYDYESVVN